MAGKKDRKFVSIGKKIIWNITIITVIVAIIFSIYIYSSMQKNAVKRYERAMFILGAVEYLLKPIEQDKLEEAVLKAVSQMKIIEEEEKFTVDKQFKRMSPDYQHGLLRKLFRPELADKA